MYLNSIGHYVPSARVDNAYFLNVNGLTDEWIVKRTGIHTRCKAGEGEDQNSMALAAVEDALSRLTDYNIKDVDLIVAASYSAYDTVATVAHETQRHYDIDGAKALYLSSACSSWVNGLEVIEGYFAMGKASKALLICSEHNTLYANEHDPKSGHLWGDAAVAAFFSKERLSPDDIQVKQIYTCGLGNIGAGPDGVKLRPRDEGIMMPDGRDVFMNACKYLVVALNTALAPEGLTIADLDYIICHQANLRIMRNVAKAEHIEPERFLSNIEELGNTGSASAPLVFSQELARFKPGDRIGITVFGGGYSCGAVLFER